MQGGVQSLLEGERLLEVAVFCREWSEGAFGLRFSVREGGAFLRGRIFEKAEERDILEMRRLFW